ncbi:right-handed parallel beta-helix repeat-containing protein [Streptomyces lunaelactis]|uniref:right-handed parallel beta-helix repeat-containing protein n=1 Tax=Streptomyces lunaelactis TaxID=1535768 RepID=UPI0015845392|nr:right-handed parallel beta-helix repeat-containing protein [Streptomyces lunaelactis]NUL04131.1 right-handed parallel beta-helix repeat-containing protein [Streptomyces lunaelactis]
MTTRYVSTKGKPGGAYDTKDHPAPTLTDALKVAVSGDVIEILDNAVYREPELVIDKALTLTSSHALANPAINPADPSFNAKQLPSIVARGEHRVMRVQGTAASRPGFGPVIVRGIQIRQGHANQSTPSDPGFGAGGGVLVVDADNVSIEQCVITENRTRTQPTPPWPEADRQALRTVLVDLMGEILSPTTVALVNIMVDAYNKMASLARLPTLTPVDQSAVLAELGASFDKALPPGRPNHWLAGQAFGGGVAAVWASPSLRKCRISANVAEGRGAGVAVVGFGWPKIADCWIGNNRSGDAGRRDGGGIGLEICLPSKLGRNLTEIDLVRFLTTKIGSLRSVIAAPASTVTVWDLMEFGRWIINPASHPGFRGIKGIILNTLRGKDHREGNWHLLLYYAATIALSRYHAEAWDFAEREKARSSAVTVTDCVVTSNRCLDDGGGLYASVLSRVQATSTRFQSNSAVGMGGGVRLSMGSDGTLSRCTFESNHAQQRGGGIACRNVNLKLTDSKVGAPASKAPSTLGNLCADGPGGGVYLEVGSEGALAGVPNLWTSILREVFLVHDVTVSVEGGFVSGNGAGFTPARAVVAKTTSAKGGGLFLVRGAFPDSPSVTLEVPNVEKVIAGNTAVTRDYESKVDRRLVPRADERCIQDILGGREWTETNDAPLISGGDLRFKS